MAKPKAFLDEESSFQGRYSNQVFETLYFAYRPFFYRMIFSLLIGMLGRFLLLANANMVGIWVDTFCQAPAICKPVPRIFAGFASRQFLLLLLLMTLLGFAFTALFRISFSRLSATAVSQFYDEVTLRTSRLPIQFFDTNPAGRIITRFSSDYSNIFRLFGGPLAEFLSILFDLGCMLVLVTIASPYYIPVIAFIAAANYIVYRLNRDSLRGERRNLSASRSPSIAHFAETTHGASTVRIFARQGTFGRKFAELNQRYLNQKLHTSTLVLKFSMQMGGLTAMLLMLTGAMGYFFAQKGWVSIGSIGVAFTFIVLSGTSLQMFFEWLAQFEEAMTGVERLNDYLRRSLEPGLKLPAGRHFPTDHPVYSQEEERALDVDVLVHGPSASISVEDLWFRYGKDLPYVLKGLNFKIQPGEKIGIVGRTGSGKSSFVQTLFYLYPFERGRILIDGQEPRRDQDAESKHLDLSLFRRSIGLISQEPTLFRGTVRENLDLATRVSNEKIHEALAIVGLTEWLNRQQRHQAPGTDPLDLKIEERGRNLSSGERQLLCMARCLLQNAPIVVMDEATSSVDPRSEEILVRATKEFFADRTQIIVAHRLSTIEHCDRVLWLHQGEIRMFDKPEKVLPIFRDVEL